MNDIYVFSIGKASIPMAEAAEIVLKDRIKYGQCICKYFNINLDMVKNQLNH